MKHLYRIQVHPTTRGSTFAWAWNLWQDGRAIKAGSAHSRDEAKGTAEKIADEIALCDEATETYEYTPRPTPRPEHWKV